MIINAVGNIIFIPFFPHLGFFYCDVCANDEFESDKLSR